MYVDKRKNATILSYSFSFQEWIDEYNCYVGDGNDNTTCAKNETCKSAPELFFQYVIFLVVLLNYFI